MKKLCKNISHVLPTGLTWSLIIGCTIAFFYCVIPAIVAQLNALGYLFGGIDVVLFMFLLANLFMATTMDPGTHPIGKFWFTFFPKDVYELRFDVNI